MEDVTNVFKEVLDVLTSSTFLAWMFRMWILFIVLPFAVRMCLRVVDIMEVKPQKEDEVRVNRIVGTILNDQQKIDYILKTYEDIETASDMIADIYVKQLQKGENYHE